MQTDKEIVLERIRANVSEWAQAKFETTQFTRLSGWSNIVMKVEHPRCETVIYRQFENEHGNKSVEALIFEQLSE